MPTQHQFIRRQSVGQFLHPHTSLGSFGNDPKPVLAALARVQPVDENGGVVVVDSCNGGHRSLQEGAFDIERNSNF